MTKTFEIGGERIAFIEIIDENTVRFEEGCDNYFYATYSKEEAVNILENAIEFIKNN